MWLCKGLFLMFLTVLIKSNGNYQRKTEYKKLLELIKSGENNIINSRTELQSDNQKLVPDAILLLKNAENYIDDEEIGDNEMNSLSQYNGFTIPSDRNIAIVVLDDGIKTLTREGLSIILSGETELMADNIKPNILRDAYTDACIKVAIRKCYQALYDVRKNVCKIRYRCKSRFKAYFKKKSKEGCIKEFDYNQGNNKMSSKFRNDKVHSTKFIDATRQGYVDACIPYMVPQYKETQIRNAVLNNRADNMLRKRSGKRCRIIFRKKCVKACLFAVNESCNFYSCSIRRWRLFEKVCGEECRRIYLGKKISDSSSSSASES